MTDVIFAGSGRAAACASPRAHQVAPSGLGLFCAAPVVKIENGWQDSTRAFDKFTTSIGTSHSRVNLRKFGRMERFGCSRIEPSSSTALFAACPASGNAVTAMFATQSTSCSHPTNGCGLAFVPCAARTRGIVFWPVRHPVSGLRDLVTAVLVEFVRHQLP